MVSCGPRGPETTGGLIIQDQRFASKLLSIALRRDVDRKIHKKSDIHILNLQ